MSKADIKKHLKRQHIARKLFEGELPPRKVAKELRVATVEVYRTAELLRKRLRSLVEKAVSREGLFQTEGLSAQVARCP